MLLKFSEWFVYTLLKLNPQSHLSKALEFFIYDSIKILLLLFVMIFVIGVLRTYLPQRKVKEWMSHRGAVGNFFAALFGAVTPFCSCSSIPIFLSFLEAGIPLGVTFSFLITSPLLNEYLAILMLKYFGWKIMALYVVSGMVIGIISGVVLGKMKLEKHLAEDMIGKQEGWSDEVEYKSFKERLRFGLHESVSVVKKIWHWVLTGVAIGAAIHNYVPEEAIQSIIGKAGFFSVPIATMLGVPMYGSCAAIVPIAVVLFQKGIPLGTALSFMMATAALSLPEAIMLRRAMKLKLIGIFFGVTSVSIVVIGFVFNILQNVLK